MNQVSLHYLLDAYLLDRGNELLATCFDIPNKGIGNRSLP